MFDYSLEHLFSYVVSVEKPQMIGPLPEGIRAIFYVTNGDVSPAVGADRRATSSSRPGGGGRRRPKSWLDRNGRGLLMAPSLLGRPSSARNTFGTRHGFGVGCSAGASPGVAPDPLREPVNLVVGRRHS